MEGLRLRQALQYAFASKGDGVSNATELTRALIRTATAMYEHRRPARSLFAGNG